MYLTDDRQESTSCASLCLVETNASVCANTGEMRCLRVNCGQGTAGLLPLILHRRTHTFIHPKVLIQTQPYSTMMQESTGQRSNASETERKEDKTISPVQSPIIPQTQMTYRSEVIDHFELFSWFESQSRPS